MRSIFIHLIVCLLPAFAAGQYFYTGKTINDVEHPLVGVTILLKRTGKIYQSDSLGSYKIPTTKKWDTLVCRQPGFDTLKTFVQAGTAGNLIMWPQVVPQKIAGQYLSSLTPNLNKDPVFIRQMNGETYKSLVENDFVKATRFPSTGFALNVNKAAYSNVRRFINNQAVMPPSAVRIEELLNYFPMDGMGAPTAKEVFTVETSMSICPWNTESILLYIQVQARKINLDNVPPGNLVFLIDDSGSMDMPNRLPLVQAAFKMLANNLRAIDTVSIVTYGGSARVYLEPTGGADKQKIIESIESLIPGGSTPGASGVKMAYQMAEKLYRPGANNRVILATDGDFNIGIINEKELENFISKYSNSSIYLTCLGVGMGNYKDSKLETLARYGKGNFAYLDNEQEAEKVLVKEFTQTAVTVANEVLLDINFDPSIVKEYRLIGYDNTQLALADTGSTLHGGEVGSGQSLIAMFEVKPDFTLPTFVPTSADKIGQFVLQYRQPGKRSLEKISRPIPLHITTFDSVNSSLQFATSVAMFGQLLRQSVFAKPYTFDEVYNIASKAAKPGDAIQQEYLKLVLDAKKVYNVSSSSKKKKK